MSPENLLKMFKSVTDREMKVGTFEDELILQHFLYILSEIGVCKEGYTYILGDFGPFSEKAYADICEISRAKLSNYIGDVSDLDNGVDFLRELWSDMPNEYNWSDWLEVIVSCVYNKRYISLAWTLEDIFDYYTMFPKKYLCQETAKGKVLEWCEKILQF